jgi:hypothetical protein
MRIPGPIHTLNDEEAIDTVTIACQEGILGFLVRVRS